MECRPTRRGFQEVAEAVSEHGERARTLCYQQRVLPEIEVLLRVASSLTGQPADAEDLVQDTLLRAWRSFDTFDGEHPRAWLLTILRNAHINGHRRQRPGLLHDPDLSSRVNSEDRPDEAASAEDAALRDSFDEAITAALAKLPEQFRHVVLLIDVDDLSYAETASLLGIPEGTVMSRLHRARKRIRLDLAAAGLAPRRRI